MMIFCKKILIFFDFFIKKNYQFSTKNKSKQTLKLILDVGAHEGGQLNFF